MGGRVISSNTGHAYYRALDVVRNFVSGSPDLAVFFLLRAFSLLRQSGCLGFVTTSAIKDTGNKEVGFDQIIAGGGEIYYASPSSPWPGSASVIVSVFSIFKGSWGEWTYELPADRASFGTGNLLAGWNPRYRILKSPKL